MGLVDSVILSMHVVLERLSPAERTSFVLHDVFQLPFEEISAIVGRSTAACRQLASRARRSVRDAANGRRFAVEDDVQRRVAERFIGRAPAATSAALLELLDPAVDGTGDVTGEPVVGADLVGPGILRYLGPAAGPTLLYVPVGVGVGIVALRDHRVLALVVLTIEDGRVVHVEALASDGPRKGAQSGARSGAERRGAREAHDRPGGGVPTALNRDQRPSGRATMPDPASRSPGTEGVP